MAKADSKLPAVATEEQAIAVGNLLLKAKGYVKCEWVGVFPSRPHDDQ